jgi:hypothetical protein
MSLAPSLTTDAPKRSPAPNAHLNVSVHRWSPDAGWQGARVDPEPRSSTLAMVFGPTQIDESCIRDLQSQFSPSALVGCSSSGQIVGADIEDEQSVAAVVDFRETTFELAYAGIWSREESFAAGMTLAKQLTHRGLRAVLVLSDGLVVNGTQLARGLNSVLPPGTIVTGGLAGDGTRFERTWVLRDGAPQTNTIAAVGFYGERFRIGHGSCGGWDVFGPERRVTRSRDNELFELDGRPALALYKEYLGPRSAELPSSALLFPLAICEDAEADSRRVRTILAVNEEANSLVFAGDIPEGASVQLMHANFERLIEAAGDSARQAMHGVSRETPRLCVSISCVGRRLVLGTRTEEELEQSVEALGPGAEQVGFYSYGELSPLLEGASCELHNQTMTMTVLSEVESDG